MVEAMIEIVCDVCKEREPNCKVCGYPIEIHDGIHDCSTNGHTCSSCLEKAGVK